MVEFTQRGFPMADATPQSYRNHARLDPPFHFVLAPLGIAAIIVSVILFVHHPRLASGLWIAFAIGLFLIAFKTRSYALRVQDRVIRWRSGCACLCCCPRQIGRHPGADRVSVDRTSFRLGCRAAPPCQAGAGRTATVSRLRLRSNRGALTTSRLMDPLFIIFFADKSSPQGLKPDLFV